MANMIRVIPDQLRDRANQYRNEQEIVDAMLAKMDALLDRLGSEWEGTAFEAFAERYQDARTVLKRCAYQIGEQADMLQRAANQMEEMDRKLAEAFSIPRSGILYPIAPAPAVIGG